MPKDQKSIQNTYTLVIYTELLLVNGRKLNKLNVLTKEKPLLICEFEYVIVMGWKQMKSRYGNRCCVCHKEIYVGSEIFWNNNGSHLVKHYDCSSDTPGARAITVPEESVDSSAQNWGGFSIDPREENDKTTSEAVPEESVDSSELDRTIERAQEDGDVSQFLEAQRKKDQVFEKKTFEQRKQEREFFREAISP